MRAKIDNKAIWMKDEKVIIELKIEKHDEYHCGEDYTTYETFKSIHELFEWGAKNIDYIREALDDNYCLEITTHSKSGEKEWFFSVDGYGSVIFSMKVDNLIDKELKDCKERLKKIMDLVR